MANFLALLKFTQLLFKYYLENGDHKSNFVISPTNLFMSWCVISEGAQNETKSELLRALGYSKKTNFCRNIEKLSEAYNEAKAENFYGKKKSRKRWLAKKRKDDGLALKINMTNSLLVNNDFKLFSSFEETLAESYTAEVRNATFSHELEQKLLEEFKKYTSNSKLIMPLRTWENRLAAVFLNTLDFDARWKLRFHENSTFNGAFYLGRKKTDRRNVEYMHQENQFRVIQSVTKKKHEFSAVFLEYYPEDMGWNMVIIQPTSKTNPELYSELISEKIFDLYKQSNYTLLSLKVPKFKIKTSIFHITPLLKAFGFDPYTYSNFSAVSYEANVNFAKMSIDMSIDVDEYGTGSDNNLVGLGCKIIKMENPPVATPLEVTSSFLFAIINTKHRIIMFAGMVNK